MVEAGEFGQIIEGLITEAGTSTTVNVISKTYSNITGDLTTASGTGTTINGIFVNKLYKDVLDREGKFKGCDAVFITNGSYTLSDNDLVTFAGSTYEVHDSETKRWNGSAMFNFSKLFAKVD